MNALTVTGLVVCCGSFLAVLALLTVVNVSREKSHRQRLERWALGTGWQVVPLPQVNWGRRMPGSSKRGVTVALSGMLRGRRVTIAEYQYTTSTTTAASTHRYVLLLVGLREAHPSIAVHERSGLSRFGRTLFGDATAVGNEPFDSAYVVTVDDPDAVRAVLAPALVDAHVAGRVPMWSLEGRELLTYRLGRIGDPATIPAQLEPLLRVADLIEPPADDQRGGDGHSGSS